jgi:myo-inositol-1-phosphate synthase
MNLEFRLSVEDSPNSAGVVIDAVRCCKLALLRGMRGVLHAPAAFFMKHPPVQLTDEEAYRLTEAFIRDAGSQPSDLGLAHAQTTTSEGYPGVYIKRGA